MDGLYGIFVFIHTTAIIMEQKLIINGNEVAIIVTSTSSEETKKDFILSLMKPTDPERAWENHKDNYLVCIKTLAEEQGVVFNILLDKNLLDLGIQENIDFIKAKISNDLATILLQDYYMEDFENKDIKLSELSMPGNSVATLGDIRVALQMTLYKELSNNWK